MSTARDWRNLDLSSGSRSLVEASAGTGKTWTIGVLYLRLMLEEGLSPRQIVVATYTNAAAAELIERLRGRLESSLLFAAQPVPTAPDSNTTDLHWLHTRWQDAALRHADAHRLALALTELDLAPIGTLHSLCARILAEHPFAAGASFQTPALVDAKALHVELADDLWRVLHGHANTLDADTRTLWQAAQPLRPTLKRDSLRKWLGTLLLPGVVVPQFDDSVPPDCTEWAHQLDALVARTDLYKRSNAALRTRWRELAEALHGWSAGQLDVATVPTSEALEKRFEDLSQDFKPDFHDDPEVKAGIATSRLAVTRLAAARQAPLARFLAAAQSWARRHLDQRLAAANQLGFDDLITTVHAALRADEQGQRLLADALFTAWPLALIDEFQDTDPVQYGILDAIYRDADGHARGRLLMIGDPKQAIYRFRGGDIHTYTRAAQSAGADNTLTLGVNRRSSKAYVDAVNAFYATVGERLGAADSSTPIRYVPVHTAPGAEALRYTHDGIAAEALVLHADVSDEASDENAALRSCADQIAALLEVTSGHRIDGHALRASDICVLVPNNRQAQAMVQLLRRRRIATVNRGRGSVMDSDTARDLLLILDAVAHCDDARRLRAALATPLWGTGYHALRALQQDETRWQAYVDQFHHWHHDWLHKGVLAVVSALIQHLAAQQLAHAEGERVLTDLRHLGELLQEASDHCDGMTSLLTWLRAQRDGGDGEDDAAEARALRLESDADCAQVMTLHASKGLEFPLVFLPLMWKHTAKQERGLILATQNDGTRHVALQEHERAQVALEEQDERFRVLYVALTRARYACHVWLPSQKGQAKDSRAAPITLAAAMLLSTTTEATAQTNFVLRNAWPAPGFRRLTDSTDTPERHPARALPAERRGPLPTRHSFTTLVAGVWQNRLDTDAAADDESDRAEVDVDALPVPAITRHPELDALLGVAGTEFGNAVHAILERHRIGEPIRAQLPLVGAQLEAFAVRDRRSAADDLAQRVAQRLDGVLEADLDGKGLRLAVLPASAQRHEMEFHYALDGVSLMRLRTACEHAGEPDLIPARPLPLLGLMTGKIDLIFQHDGRFHVLDWKGNRLGAHDEACLEDYAPAALIAAMDTHHYRFQALLYTLALDRYLRSRIGERYARDRHLGECWYLFIRASGLRLPDGTPCGIWRQRFSDALIDAAQQALATSHVEAA